MAALVVVFAWTVLQGEGEAETVVALARRIERAERVDPAYIVQIAQRVETGTFAGSCESRTLKAGLTVLLRRLDQIDPRRDEAAYRAALAATRVAIDRALACTPTDGNLWLRRAMVGLAEKAAPEQVRHDLARSQRFAPAERRVIAGRYSVWNRLPTPELEKAAPDLLADIDMICANPHFMAWLPKAELPLQLFLAEQADRRMRNSAAAIVGKTSRPRPKEGVARGPGLWCSQSTS